MYTAHRAFAVLNDCVGGKEVIESSLWQGKIY